MDILSISLIYANRYSWIQATVLLVLATPFLLRSSKSFQPTPSKHTVEQLKDISSRLDTVIRNTATISTSLDPATDILAFYIHTFWVFSFLLSLKALILGICALHWITERQLQEYEVSCPTRSFCTFNLRLDRSDLPYAYTMVPMLLQLAILFFVAGFVGFCYRLLSELL